VIAGGATTCRLGSVFTVLITGPPGVGKTSVLTALVDALTDDDVPHAAIELEALAWTHPELGDELWRRQVETTCALYREAGHRLLLVVETLETDDDLNRLLDVLGAAETFLVRLEARPETLVERIVEREPESWSGLAGLVEHTQELAVTMPALSGVDLVLTTEAQRPEAVADRIRVALPAHLDRRGTRGSPHLHPAVQPRRGRVTASPVSVRVLDGELAVCRLPAGAPAPPAPAGAELFAVTRTREELSVVCPAAHAPADATVEPGWRALCVLGPLDFGLTGILASLAAPLAAAGVSIFAISTYDTDYVLVREDALAAAVEALRGAGHVVSP